MKVDMLAPGIYKFKLQYTLQDLSGPIEKVFEVDDEKNQQ